MKREGKGFAYKVKMNVAVYSEEVQKTNDTYIFKGIQTQAISNDELKNRIIERLKKKISLSTYLKFHKMPLSRVLEKLLLNWIVRAVEFGRDCITFV